MVRDEANYVSENSARQLDRLHRTLERGSPSLSLAEACVHMNHSELQLLSRDWYGRSRASMVTEADPNGIDIEMSEDEVSVGAFDLKVH